MSAFLFGVPGKLATLLARITSTRTTAIDTYLDAGISSRAAAATALSNADYTSARAAKLDLLKFGTRAHADPRRLPLYWERASVYINGGTNYSSAAGFWTTDLNNTQQYFIASVATNDTYVTVASVSGRGVFAGILGPRTDNNGDTTTFRITVDGTVYTIAGTFNATPSGTPRLCLWASELMLRETNSFSATLDGIPAVAISQATSLMSPSNAIRYGYQHVYFASSLLVEAKISTLPTSGDPRKCVAAYLLEKGSVA